MTTYNFLLCLYYIQFRHTYINTTSLYIKDHFQIPIALFVLVPTASLCASHLDTYNLKTRIGDVTPFS